MPRVLGEHGVEAPKVVKKGSPEEEHEVGLEGFMEWAREKESIFKVEDAR